PSGQSSCEHLVASADQALYRAKREGRNRVAGIDLAGAVAGDHAGQTPARAERWPAPVWIDPVHAERMPAVLAGMRAQVRGVEAAARACDFARVRGAARQLASTAGSYGFDRVRSLTGSLDQAAAHGALPAIAAAAAELTWYLDRVPVVYCQK